MDPIKNFIQEKDFDIKAQCCGCGVCADICPKHCISMTADAEGFLYPSIDSEKCVSCGKCVKVCPVINVKPEIPFEQHAYIVQHKDEKIRKESTSGGAFTAISEYVLEQGGIVFGAAFVDNDFHVEHIGVESKEDLWRFRNSKYVQSVTYKAFPQAEKALNASRLVCFSGTPCQIEGLKAYLEKEYDNLLTVDVVCRAVPSPLVFSKYVEMQRQRYGMDAKKLSFRKKTHGYKYSTMSIEDENGNVLYSEGIDTDPYLRAFFSNICDRPSCYSCKFKKRFRASDITLWDCFTVYHFDESFDDDRGTTSVLVHTDKANEILQNASMNLQMVETVSDVLAANAREMVESVPVSAKRAEFMQDAALMSGSNLFEKYFPNKLKTRIHKFIRLMLLKTGLYRFMKKLIAISKGR